MSSGRHRKNSDLIKLIQSKHEVTMLEETHEFAIRFHGPQKTPYAGGVWNIRVHLGDDYPFKSPSVGFMNPIFHPNIDEVSGSVCMNVLNQSWSPLYDLTNIVETFLPQLLIEPNAEDPLNKVAAALFLRKPEEFERFVKRHTATYATEEALRNIVLHLSKSDSESSMSDND